VVIMTFSVFWYEHLLKSIASCPRTPSSSSQVSFAFLNCRGMEELFSEVVYCFIFNQIFPSSRRVRLSVSKPTFREQSVLSPPRKGIFRMSDFFSGYRRSFPEVRGPGREVNH
jgi:hypothetical protein